MEVEVILLEWPAEEARRVDLRAQGVPRLLLVEDGASIPSVVDDLEDWVRMPANDLDLGARIHNLSLRADQRSTTSPELDGNGVLHVGEDWVALSPTEARVTRVLLKRRRSLVPREMLVSAGWPAGAPSRTALDVLMVRLRGKLTPVGLGIRTLHGRGYVLE